MSVSLLEVTLSALAQLLVLGGVPLLGYAAYHRFRHGRRWPEIASRTGLARCAGRYLAYSALFSLLGVVAISVWPPPLEPFTREGSAFRKFAGLGPGPAALLAALLYGAVQTGFTEELVFRGLIAGSLARRLPLVWANLAQAAIFLLPHLLILYVMPETWPLLPLIFAGSLVLGWLRIASGSILPPWLMHASANVAVALSVAIRSAS